MLSVELSYPSLHVPDLFFPSMNDRAEPGTPDLDTVLREIYVLYSDCALVRYANEDDEDFIALL